ncbi:MAG: hypothetical protein ACREVP_06055 [Burkholderiales bacterium]
MKTPNRGIARSMTATLAAALLAAGCAQPPKDVVVGGTIEKTFNVEAIDYANRMVMLTGNEGPMAVFAGPEVRNLDQVKPGDRVLVRYREAIAAELVKPGTGVAGVQSSITTARALAGDRPFAATTERTRMTVKVFDVDTVANVVEVTGPSGFNRRVKVMDPKAREFIRGLKRGDEVEVTITEAAAISVQPAR